MDRISVRSLATAIRLIREPVVVTYSYPRSHPLYGAGEECGVFVPMSIYQDWAADYAIQKIDPGIKVPDVPDTEYMG
jgi:hypothetical protein